MSLRAPALRGPRCEASLGDSGGFSGPQAADSILQTTPTSVTLTTNTTSPHSDTDHIHQRRNHKRCWHRAWLIGVTGTQASSRPPGSHSKQPLKRQAHVTQTFGDTSVGMAPAGHTPQPASAHIFADALHGSQPASQPASRAERPTEHGPQTYLLRTALSTPGGLFQISFGY